MKFRFFPKFKEKYGKTYIIPTGYGAAFGVVCLLLFGIAFASTNNAIYFLCFFMVSLGSQSLVITNRNTDKLQITQSRIDDFFADETGQLVLDVHNPSTQELRAIELKLPTGPGVTVEHLNPGERRQLFLPLTLCEPGAQALPELKISSEFPYHFSRSWKKLILPQDMTVYPARRGQRAFASAALTTTANADSHNWDDFKGHRDYLSSDSPRSIDWKVSARLQKVLVKEFEPQNSHRLTLRWEDCPQSTDSEKKSQLSLWIDLADKNNYDYALELPLKKIPLGQGARHKTACLRALL